MPGLEQWETVLLAGLRALVRRDSVQTNAGQNGHRMTQQQPQAAEPEMVIFKCSICGHQAPCLIVDHDVAVGFCDGPDRHPVRSMIIERITTGTTDE